MSGETVSPFERNARTVLEESVQRIDARTRSRLNQARQRAVAAMSPKRSSTWRGLNLMPAAGAIAAAVLVAFVLFSRGPRSASPPTALDAQHAEDVELLTDKDSIDLMEGWDGSFYEWAASQPEGNVESNT